MQVEVISQLNEGFGNNGTIDSQKKISHVKLKADKYGSPWSPKGKKNPRYVSLMDKVLNNRTCGQLDCKMDTIYYKESRRSYDGVLHEDSGDTEDAPQLQLRHSSTKVRVRSAEAINGLSYGRDCETLYTGYVPVAALVPQGSPPLAQALSSSESRLSDTNSKTKLASLTFYDVEVLVQPRQGGHVPLVSLLSKIIGTTIIGHPVTVEVMEILSLPLNNWQKPASKQLQRNKGSAAHKVLRIFSEGLTLKSPAKKKKSGVKRQGISPRKIRTLSSLTVTNHEGMKAEKKPIAKEIGEPVISHVPIKLVFRRLKEALFIF